MRGFTRTGCTVTGQHPKAVMRKALLRRYPRLGQFRLDRRLHHVERVLHVSRIVGERDVELALALEDTVVAEATIEPTLHVGVGAQPAAVVRDIAGSVHDV